MLSSICTHIFQSSDEFNLKSRIQIYHYIVQSTLRSWTTQNPNISEHILFNFLIDLAVYIHSQSSSGLIDGFDIEHLCYSSLKKLLIFKSRTQLYTYAKELISLLDMNVDIVVERDLQVFGFSHLTFREYFVAQSLVRDNNSIENVMNRILAYTIHSSFREPLLFALSWISWKWKNVDYDKFCNLLVSPSQYYEIPFGTLLFFDAFDDLLRLPSNTTIFKALNNILDHPSDALITTYFIPNLFKLHKDILEEWMQKNSFVPTNTILLSSMYLTELAFDAQILKMYTNNDIKIEISPQKKLQQLWNDSIEYPKMMTFELASWITNYLEQITNKIDLDDIIKYVSQCLEVERKALPIVEKWLKYRMDKDLKYFAYYTAFIFVKQCVDIPNLIEIVNEALLNDDEFHLKPFIRDLFHSQPANLHYIHQILVMLHKNIRYSSQISVHIENEEILELLLNLELERITTSNIDRITQPYLLMITGCSEHLEVYLKKYLVEFVNTEHTVEINIKDEYLAIIINNFQCFEFDIYAEVFTQDEMIIHLENVIYSWKMYSEDVLSVGLLAYGNCILKLEELKRNRIFSEEIQNTLITLFETSPSELIFIRAAFCLIYIHYPNMSSYNTIWNWLENKKTVTLKQRYTVQLQLTLYQGLNPIFHQDAQLISDFVDLLISNLYDYLCNKENIDYLADPTPNYVNLALEFCKMHYDIFRNALQNSSFGEEKFRKEYIVYFYQTNDPSHRKILAHLYAVFANVTHDLIDMLKWIDSVESSNEVAEYAHKYVASGNGWKCLDHIHHISNRDIIEMIFRSLDSTCIA
ncbi:unnamed protein product [Rotaria sordida]|uniref:Uncharacterized protein n=1 Tax=Rotaria sordida TaxID=392033 RepID=A0A815QXN0_9BILA|nr:unnamed protein product [Rotaria sordida]